MVEQGLEFAAARIQGLVRGKRIRRVFASIWQQAEEYARDIVRGERDARLKREKEQRAREKVRLLNTSRDINLVCHAIHNKGVGHQRYFPTASDLQHFLGSRQVMIRTVASSAYFPDRYPFCYCAI